MTSHGLEVLEAARGQVIDHKDLVATLEETFYEVRTDESGAAGDQDAHGVLTEREPWRPTYCEPRSVRDAGPRLRCRLRGCGRRRQLPQSPQPRLEGQQRP